MAYTAWTKGIENEDKKKEFLDLLKNSNTVLGKLKQILQDQERSLDEEQIAARTYDQPNWAYAQADYNGCKRTLRKTIDLITIK